MYERHGFLAVEGGGEGYGYLIYPHRPVVPFDTETGEPLSELCVRFPDRESLGDGAGEWLPGADDVLAKWMALRADERTPDLRGQPAPARRPARPRAWSAATSPSAGWSCELDNRRDDMRAQLVVFDGPERAHARAYMKGIGFDDADLKKPVIGIANTWIEAMPCNFHLRAVAEKVKEGVRAAGGTPMEFNTIAVSDGVTMGTQGMKASLVSREVIADSIELTVRGYQFDALVAVCACDKTIPGSVMALARLDIPSVLLYGGSILPGRYQDRDVTIQDIFEAVGAHAKGDMTDEELNELEDVASPGPGACGGMFTANTMATAFEVMGIAPMGSGMVPAVAEERKTVSEQAGELVMNVLRARPAPEPDHHPRVARERDRVGRDVRAGRPTSSCTCSRWRASAASSSAIDDFDEISERTPLLGDLKPGGRFVARDLNDAGGVGLIVKRLDEAGLLHRDAITVTGRTIGEEADDAVEAEGQEVVRPAGRPPEGDRRPRDPARATSLRRAASSRSPATSASSTPARPGCSSPRRSASPRSRPARSRPATSS